MGSATVATLNTKLNADPAGLLAGLRSSSSATNKFGSDFAAMQAKLRQTSARASAITIQYQSPDAALRKTTTELQRMAADGVISLGTLRRATAAANAEFAKTMAANLGKSDLFKTLANAGESLRRVQANLSSFGSGGLFKTLGEAAQQLNRAQSRAATIRLDVQTPIEKYRETRRELQLLAADGLIAGETLRRAMARATEGLAKSQFNAMGPGFAKAIDGAMGAMREAQARASSITGANMLPIERLMQARVELGNLRRDGQISLQTLQRATTAANQEFLKLQTQGVQGLTNKLRTITQIATVGLFGAAGFGLKQAADLEKTSIAFEVLTKSAQKSKEIISQLRQLGDTTSLEFPALKAAATSLLATGQKADDILPIVQMLGELTSVSENSAEALKLVTKALTDTASKGALKAQETTQFSENSIPILKLLSDTTGKTTKELLAMREAGQITYPMVLQALAQATQKGGDFHGMLKRIAEETTSGKFSILVDNARRLSITFGQALLPTATRVVAILNGIANVLNQVSPSTIQWAAGITAVVAAFGGFIVLTVKIVGAIRTIVTALRAMAIAQTITQALSGPKGWATVAAGLLVAGGAAYMVSTKFEELGNQMNTASAKSKDLADTVKDAYTKAAGGSEAAVEGAKELNKEWDKHLEKLNDMLDPMKELDELMKRGEHITLEMRTPKEKFLDTIADLQKLRDVGAISGRTFERAWQHAADELQKAIDKTDELKQKTEGVAAVTMNSTAGFSAVQESIREMSANAAKPKRDLPIMREEIEKALGRDGGDQQNFQDEEREIQKALEEEAKKQSGYLATIAAKPDLEIKVENVDIE